ncbi:MAG TPA: hypothetical protein VK551_07020 [Thermodesulfobacteriota bacterium]|nr:hypothetical protein [Thermodesulfobacteriota bacterium]
MQGLKVEENSEKCLTKSRGSENLRRAIDEYWERFERRERKRGDDQMKSLSVKLGVILVVTVVATLTYAEDWGTECAWVLWLKHCSYIGKTEGNKKCEWKLEEAYPTYDECMKEREHIWTHYKKQFPKSEGVQFGYLILSRGSEGALTINFQCFPFTVDPRK